MKNIPILIVHKGDSFYLEEVLRHVRLFNPENRICLISDPSTNHYDFVEHYDVADYMIKANRFEQIYEHLSINAYSYELFCFQRWYVIWEFSKKQNMDYFVCLDSDILLYCDVNEVFTPLLKYDFTICKEIGPCFTLFNKYSIERFCGYMTSLYETENLDRLRNFYKTIDYGGVCDMTVFAWYQKEISNNVLDLIYPLNQSCFDGNISDSMGFEMQGRLKKIYWVNDLPYGKWLQTSELIRFYGLHLQGGTKHKMHNYILNNKKKREYSVIVKLKWILSYKRLNSRFKEAKKMLSSRAMFILTIRNLFGVKL